MSGVSVDFAKSPFLSDLLFHSVLTFVVESSRPKFESRVKREEGPAGALGRVRRALQPGPAPSGFGRETARVTCNALSLCVYRGSNHLTMVAGPPTRSPGLCRP